MVHLNEPIVERSLKMPVLVQDVVLQLAACASCAGCSFLLATWNRVEKPTYTKRHIFTSIGLAGLLTSVAFAMFVWILCRS